MEREERRYRITEEIKQDLALSDARRTEKLEENINKPNWRKNAKKVLDCLKVKPLKMAELIHETELDTMTLTWLLDDLTDLKYICPDGARCMNPEHNDFAEIE